MRRHMVLFACLSCLLVLAGCVVSENYEAGNKLLQQNQYEKAIAAYERALPEAQYDPELQQRIKQAMEQAKAALVDRALQQAQYAAEKSRPITLSQLDEALAVLGKYRRYDDQAHRLSKRTAQYTEMRNKLSQRIVGLVEESNLLAKQGKHDLALKKLEEAVSLNPEGKTVKQHYAQAKARYTEYLANALRAELARKNWPAAHKFLAKLKEADPGHPLVADAGRRISEKELEDTRHTIGNLMNAQQYYRAYLMVQSSAVKGQLKDLEQRIREAGGAYYVKRAQKDLAANKYFRAYVAAVKAKELSPYSGQAFSLHKQAEDLVDRAMYQYIAVPAFDSPRNDPDAGKQFSDDLISYLFRLAPYGIKVVERQKIDLALKEKSGDVSKAGELLGVNMIITGNVSLLKVDNKEHTLKAIAKVPVGTRRQINPEYQMMAMKYGNDTSNWPMHVPMMVEHTEYSAVPYVKGSRTMAGFINVSVRIFDVANGSILYANVFKMDKRFRDQFQDGVPQAEPPIKDDPLDLPTDTEVKGQLREAVIQQIAKVIIKQFENREKKFLSQAQYYLQRREAEMALAELAKGHLFAKRSGLKAENPHLVQINELILQVTE